MASYATQSDVYKYALPRGSLGNPGRLVAASLAATSTIELEEHGFSTGTPVTFRVTQGGSLSSPLVAGTIYYVLYVSDSFFQVSATSGGAPITLTTDGVSVQVATDLPWADVGEFYSRWADAFLPAEAVPLATPYPITVVGIVAQLMAAKMQRLSGTSSESMDKDEIAAKAQLERFAKGIPVRDVAATQVQTNLAVSQPKKERLIGSDDLYLGGVTGVSITDPNDSDDTDDADGDDGV